MKVEQSSSAQATDVNLSWRRDKALNICRLTYEREPRWSVLAIHSCFAPLPVVLVYMVRTIGKKVEYMKSCQLMKMIRDIPLANTTPRFG